MYKLYTLLFLVSLISCGLVLDRSYFTSRMWTFGSSGFWSGYPLQTTFYENNTAVIGTKPPVTFTWWYNSTVFLSNDNYNISCLYETPINSYHPGRTTDIVVMGACKMYNNTFPSSLMEITN